MGAAYWFASQGLLNMFAYRTQDTYRGLEPPQQSLIKKMPSRLGYNLIFWRQCQSNWGSLLEDTSLGQVDMWLVCRDAIVFADSALLFRYRWGFSSYFFLLIFKQIILLTWNFSSLSIFWKIIFIRYFFCKYFFPVYDACFHSFHINLQSRSLKF